MNDAELDRLIASAMIGDAQIERLDIGTGEQALLEEIMAVTTPTTTHRSRRPFRTRRKPVLAGVLAIGALAGVGAAAATGMFDSSVEEMVASVDCNITTDDARLAISAVDSRGSTIELWTIDTNEGFANLIIERSGDGTTNGASMGCGAQTRATAYPPDQPWAVAPSLTDQDATLVRLYGWAPKPAVAVFVELSDGTTVTAQTSPDGYFLKPITIAPNSDIDVVRVRALASDGAIVAES
ncbi:MAG: hypothetical protein RLZZ362_485 [Actinomycetota bacterium]|jgi:hypothetical protein